MPIIVLPPTDPTKVLAPGYTWSQVVALYGEPELVPVPPEPPGPRVLQRGDRGIDVSHWQGPIDWARVAASGVKFCAIKASTGEFGRDPEFGANWRGAKAADLFRAAYHWFTPVGDPLKQAENILKLLRPDAGELGPVVDVEEGSYTISRRAAYTARLKVFLDAITNAIPGQRPIIYTRAEVWRNITTSPDWASDYALWAAWYNAAPPTVGAGLPAGWASAWGWQYSKTGRTPGIVNDCDLDVACLGEACVAPE